MRTHQIINCLQFARWRFSQIVECADEVETKLLIAWAQDGFGNVEKVLMAMKRRMTRGEMDDLVIDQIMAAPVAPRPHEWIEVGARRWCIDCGSYQVRRNGVWHDDMVGPWPGYNTTDIAAHDH